MNKYIKITRFSNGWDYNCKTFGCNRISLQLHQQSSSSSTSSFLAGMSLIFDQSWSRCHKYWPITGSVQRENHQIYAENLSCFKTDSWLERNRCNRLQWCSQDQSPRPRPDINMTIPFVLHVVLGSRPRPRHVGLGTSLDYSTDGLHHTGDSQISNPFRF